MNWRKFEFILHNAPGLRPGVYGVCVCFPLLNSQ